MGATETTGESAHVEVTNSSSSQNHHDDEEAYHTEKSNSTSGDIAAQLVDNAVATGVTPELEKAVLRRIDMFLMPVMFLSMAFQYLDKACLTGAALFGILTDLKLIEIVKINGKAAISNQRYSYCALIFYWGYLIGLLPGVYFSQRFPVGKYVSIVMFLWGGVTVCTVAVKTYEGLLIQRFFLGVAEAGIAPAFSLITAMWYKRQEQPLRFAFWYSAVGLGTLVGTLLLYAIGQINGPMPAWRYQFMIIGCMTSVWGIALWFLCPDSPVTAYFLTKEQKVAAVERMRYEQSGIENKTIKFDQIKEAFTDPKTWFYVLATFLCNFTNGAVTGFGSIIVKSFGFSSLRTILLLGGAGVWAFVFLLVGGTISCYVRNTRTFIGMFCCIPVIVGSAMVWKSEDWGSKTSNRGVPLWGFYMMAVFSTTYVMILALMAANTGGHTKKAVTAGLVWASYCISNGIAPLTVFIREEKQHYPTAFIIILVMMSCTFLLIFGFRFYVEKLNQKRDAIKLVNRDEAAMTAFLDMTDGKNENFRFMS